MQWLRYWEADDGVSVLLNLDHVWLMKVREDGRLEVHVLGGGDLLLGRYEVVEVITDKAELDLQLTGVDPDE